MPQAALKKLPRNRLDIAKTCKGAAHNTATQQLNNLANPQDDLQPSITSPVTASTDGLHLSM